MKANSAPVRSFPPWHRSSADAPVTLKSSDLSQMSSNERLKVESKGLFYVASAPGC
jgi:hypothetical protein